MSQLPEHIESDRLVLRPFRADDAQDIFEYASDPDVTRYMDWPTHQTINTAREWINFTLAARASGDEYTWGITTAERPERIMGAIGCRRVDFKVSFGYVLGKPYWGRGYATEAAGAVVDLLSRQSVVQRIWATCDVDNAASANVLKKVGCTLEGTLRKWSIRPNMPGAPPRDSLMFAKILGS